MALTVWTELSGFNLGTYPENKSVAIPLPVSTSTGVIYSVIAGKLPPGLFISGNTINGTPYEVLQNTTFEFCIRASSNGQISDRTFYITIDNTDGPTFVTPSGILPIGSNFQYYVKSNSYVNFQIEVNDPNISAGAVLKFSIDAGSGNLPPGLILTEDGFIVGIVKPIYTLLPTDGSGAYDESLYDVVGYDFATLSNNGFDSFAYDDVNYDFSLPQQQVTQLNLTYNFIVTVTDGYITAKQKYQINVVGDSYFSADNTTLLDSSTIFTSDSTYVVSPVWITSSNLGIYRANNYITIPLSTYDTSNIIYNFESINARSIGFSKKLLSLDNNIGDVSLTIFNTVISPQIGQNFNLSRSVPGADNTTYTITQVDYLSSNTYRITITPALSIAVPDNTRILFGDKSQIGPINPNNLNPYPYNTFLQYDATNNVVAGVVPYQPTATATYYFTITATRISATGEVAVSSKLFQLTLLGQVDSTITWNTNSNLGIINPGLVSTLSVSAVSTVPNATVTYSLVSGTLPPGLTLSSSGEILGKANQYGSIVGNTTFDSNSTYFDYQNTVFDNQIIKGITSFDKNTTTFDNNNTSFDLTYTFIIQAQDQFGYSASQKSFTLTVGILDTVPFSNIRVQPYLNQTQRSLFENFILDAAIFPENLIYRVDDPDFGLRQDLSMLIYAGIETTIAAAYIGAIGLNHKKKQFFFGDVKTAIAYQPGSKIPVYEVVYVEMIDPLSPNGLSLPLEIKNLGLETEIFTVDNSLQPYRIPSAIDQYISVDSTGYQASNPRAGNYYPNSITNWRNRISTVGATEQDFLPLWMRSIQAGTKTEIGFKLAVPLCYCTLGSSSTILLNIKNNGFDFKQLNYTVDRYIIDSITGYNSDKYLVFRNDRITI